MAIGLDASSDALAYAARRAVRDRVRNLVLLRDPIEALPLESLADEVTIHFPWGSLLSGALAEDEDVLDAICRLPRPGGGVTIIWSITDWDGRRPLTERDIARARHTYRFRGFTLEEDRAVVRADVDAARSTWGKRLDVGGRRTGRLLRFVARASDLGALGPAKPR